MKIEIPDNKTLVHQCLIPIRWGDMDAVGHVNNTNYIRYLEIARTEWMMAMRDRFSDEGYPAKTGAVIVNVFCNFYLPLKFPGNVLAKLYVSDLGRSTFDTWVTMELEGEEGKVYAAGGATVIWIDMAKEKAVSLPNWLRQELLTCPLTAVPAEWK